MSLLADLMTFWATNTALDTALDSTKVYTGVQPENGVMPYAVIVPIGQYADYDVCGKIENFTFQIQLFDDNLADVETLADTVMGQFDDNFAGLTTKLIGIWRDNRITLPDTSSPRRVWQCVLQYTMKASR